MDAKVDYRRLVEAKLDRARRRPGGRAPPAAAGSRASEAGRDAARRASALAGVLALRCDAGTCSSPDRPDADAAASRSTPPITRPPGLEGSASAASSFPLVAGGQRRRRSPWPASDGNVLALEADSGRELWRANVGAKLVRRRRQRRPLRRGGHARQRTGRARGRQGAVAQARSASRVATAPLVAGERVFVLGVDRVVQAFDALDGRQALDAAAPRRCADAGAGRACSRPFKDTLVVGQGPRLAGVDPLRGTCAGRWRSARRAAPTRSSGWPIWSARRCASATCSARARSRRPSAASMPSAARSLWTQATSAAPTASAATPSCVFGADAIDRITAWQRRQRRRRLDAREAAVPRPERAAGRRRRRSCSATSKATCTGSPATTASRSCA